MNEIPGYDGFIKIEPVHKGWSGDKKYYIETVDGHRMFSRVSDISELDRKKAEYNMMERVYRLGVLTSEPLGFGLCGGGKNCYSLSGWIDGEDAEKALPGMSETKQYALGVKTGKMLRKTHTLPAPSDADPWGVRFRRKVQPRIDYYKNNKIKSGNADIIAAYLENEQHILDSRPQTFNRGDFNLGNIIFMPDGRVASIDFNNFNKDYGDPWWELDCLVWGSEPPAYFYTGMIKGYFDGEPPSDFFKVFLYYQAYNALAALCDSAKGSWGTPEDGIINNPTVSNRYEN